MKIKPLKDIVYIKLQKVDAGLLDTSSRESAIEYAEVIAIGEGVNNLKVGDKVFVKSWAIDKIKHDDVSYYFVNINTGGILALVK